MDGVKKNPIKMDDLGVPPFQETPYIYKYIYIYNVTPRNYASVLVM